MQSAEPVRGLGDGRPRDRDETRAARLYGGSCRRESAAISNRRAPPAARGLSQRRQVSDMGCHSLSATRPHASRNETLGALGRDDVAAIAARDLVQIGPSLAGDQKPLRSTQARVQLIGDL